MFNLDSLPQSFVDNVNSFCGKLRRRHITGSYHTASSTLSLINELLDTRDFETWSDLRDAIVALGRTVLQAQPLEMCVANVFHRVLTAIKEPSQAQVPVSTFSILTHPYKAETCSLEDPYNIPITPNSFIEFTDSLSELENQITCSYEDLKLHAPSFLQSSEIILVIGHSTTIFEFLTGVKSDKISHVFVLERAPDYSGHRMASRIASAGIPCSVVHDGAAAALMPRVSKVLISTHAVLADGGLFAPTGTGLIARVASQYRVPVICLCATYKLSFLYVKSQHSRNVLLSPSIMFPLASEKFSPQSLALTEFILPQYEYVPPSFVSIYLTNEGTHNPSDIYRLAAQYYDLGFTITEE
ncbi:hypothetical protein RCL1_001610 [Eukaryota sp. TZLM3-RCL]